MDTMTNTCDKCIYFGRGTLVCFCEANEGMRVLDPNKNSCQYFASACGTLVKCPRCGNGDIRYKAGLLTDLFTCKKCGYEWR